jgi:HlyD family secretion protein
MKVNKKRLFTLIGILALVTFIIYVGISGTKDNKAEKFYLKTIEVKTEEISSTVFTSGKVNSKINRDLSFKNSGNIKNIYFYEGDFVKKGAIIAELDTEKLIKQIRSAKLDILINQKNIDKLRLSGVIDYETQYKNSKISYKNAKKNYDNNLILFNKEIISETELIDFENLLKVEENEYISIKNKYEGYGNGIDLEIMKLQLEDSNIILNDLENDLENTKLISPIDGTITKKIVELGDYVSENNFVFTVETIDNLIVKTDISQYDINDIKCGQAVLISRNGDIEEFDGIVDKISPIALDSTQASVVPVEIRITSTSFYKPNYSVNVEIETDFNKNAKIIPYEAILKDEDNKDYVFKLDNGKAKKVNVKKGINGALSIEVISDGLLVDDVVILNPPIDLKDGSIVESLNDEL